MPRPIRGSDVPEPLLTHETGRFLAGFASIMVCAVLAIRCALILPALAEVHRPRVEVIDGLLERLARVALLVLALVLVWAWLAGELAAAPTVAVYRS